MNINTELTVKKVPIKNRKDIEELYGCDLFISPLEIEDKNPTIRCVATDLKLLDRTTRSEKPFIFKILQ